MILALNIPKSGPVAKILFEIDSEARFGVGELPLETNAFTITQGGGTIFLGGVALAPHEFGFSFSGDVEQVQINVPVEIPNGASELAFTVTLSSPVSIQAGLVGGGQIAFNESGRYSLSTGEPTSA